MNPLLLMSGLAPGGAERVTVSFLRHLQERGEGVPLCTLTQAGHDRGLEEEIGAAGVDRFDLGARRLADPVAFTRLLGLLRRRRADLVHAHGQDAAVMAHWARRAGRFRLVITRHVVDEPSGDFRQRARAGAAKSALKGADAVVAVSGSAADRLSELGAVPRDGIDVIPNGIDLDRFDPDANAAGGCRARRELGLAPETLTVLMPAVLRPGKGHETLFRAVPEVRDQIPGATFLLAGDGERADTLSDRAKALGGAIRLLGHRSDMPALMAASDLVCLPSRSEAYPTVLMEAAASSRAVVATRVGGVPEIVDPDETGTLVPPDDGAALARALIDLLRNRDRRRRFGRAAFAKAHRRFGMGTQVGRTVALWRRVLGEEAT